MTEPILVIVLRLLVPLTIIRLPFFGIIASVIVDAFDVVIADFVFTGSFSNYHSFDKLMDTYHLAIAFFVSLRWDKIAKITSGILFFYRMVGVMLFEITGVRIYLFIFQNLFENFFIFEVARQKYFGGFKLNKRNIIIILLILLIPKMIQEYMLHYLELKPWSWIKSKLFS